MTGRADYDRDELTPRQLEVLSLVAIGWESKAVAKRLFVVEQTVKHHMDNVYRKLGVHNRSAAVWRALELGLIEPPVPLDAEVKGCPHCGKAYL